MIIKSPRRSDSTMRPVLMEKVEKTVNLIYNPYKKRIEYKKKKNNNNKKEER